MVSNDPYLEQEEIKRKRALLQALQARGELPAGKMSSMFYVRPPAWGSLASTLADVITGRKDKKLAEEEKALKGRMDAEVSQVAQALLSGGEGSEAMLAKALSSRDPRLQQIGQMRYGADLASGRQKPAERWSDPYETKIGDKTLLAQKNLATNAVQAIGGDAPSTNVTVNPTVKFDNKVDEKRAEVLVKQLGELEDTGRRGIDTKQKIAYLRSLDKAGTFSGQGANFQEFLTNTADWLGFPISQEDKLRLANTSGYGNVVAKQIADYLTAGGGVGRSLTDADREKLEQAFPQITQSAEARQIVYDIVQKLADKDIARMKEARKRWNSRKSGELPEGLFDEEEDTSTPPGTPVTAPPKRIRFEDM